MKEIDIFSLARANVRKMKPYSSARDDFQGVASVFLDANENPFDSAGYNRYPDPHQRRLKEVMAGLNQIDPDQIFLGNGSDEAIDLLFRIFCNPGVDQVLIPQPTYGMYSVSAAINDVEVISTTLSPSFNLDASTLLKAVTPKTKLIFLCSPNNPSGNLLSATEIEHILHNFSGIVVIDEAYIDFSGSASWITRLNEFRNLAVLQTFSKAWGMAGLRLGLCFANPTIIQLLNKIKPPYNINAFTQSETLRCLQERQHEKETWVEEIIRQRDELGKSLMAAPCVKKIFPSDANFLLVEVTDAKLIYGELVRQGIIVRDRSTVVLCEQCLRITVGTKEENYQLLQVMRLI